MLREIKKEEMINDLQTPASNTKVNESIKDDVLTPQLNAKKQQPKRKKASNFGNWKNFSRNIPNV